MEYKRMLAELFEQEDSARDMAKRLMQIAQTSREAAAAERATLIEFLRGPMERHMEYEERAVFPHLTEHGLTAEVGVATKQHDAVRQAANDLAALGPDGDVARIIFDTARLLIHHTNFEGDYIYPELTHEEWLDLMKNTVDTK